MYSVRLIFFDLCQEAMIFDKNRLEEQKLVRIFARRKKIFFDLF
jgi:hypothetical protein